MSEFPSGAVEAARQLRQLFDARDAVRKALAAVEEAEGDARHQRAFDLAVHHGAVRAVGYILDWPAAERGAWLDTLLNDAPTRAFADELIERASKPAVRLALAGAMPGSFPIPDAAAWEALRARLRAQPDEPIWGDPEGTALRKLWVTPHGERVKLPKPRLESLLPDDRCDDAPGEPVKDVLAEVERRIDEQALPLVFVHGAAGLGKSSLCIMLADRLAARDDVWPVLVRLRDVDPQRRLLPEVDRILAATKLGFTQGLSAAPRVVLVLDGLDELGDASRGGNAVFLSQLRDALREGAVHAAVVTARDTLHRERDALLPDEAEVLRLLPFDRPRVKAWCAAWEVATGHAFDGERFWKRSEKRDALREIASHPLMLYMLARMEAAGQPVDAAAKDTALAKVYRTIVDWCCRRHLDLRPNDPWNDRAMRRFLRAAGFAALAKGREVLHLDDLRAAIVALGLEVGDDNARFAAERTVLAFARRGPEEMTWEFTHRSFGEYLAAEWLAVQALSLVERASNPLDPDVRWRLDDAETAREWLSAFGVVQLPERVLRMFLWVLDEAAPDAYEKLRERLGEVYRALIDEREAEEAIRVARRWGTKPGRVRGMALANLCMVAGAKQRFRPEEVYPNHFLEAAHVIRSVAAGGELRRVHERIGLQGIRNEYVNAASHSWSGFEFVGVDASDCDFSDAKMESVIFDSTNLDRSRFRGARLWRATFEDCSIRDADFSGANLYCAYFEWGDVAGTSFQGVHLVGATISIWGTQNPFPPIVAASAAKIRLLGPFPAPVPSATVPSSSRSRLTGSKRRA